MSMQIEENLDTLYPDIFAVIIQFLDLCDVVTLSEVSHRIMQLTNDPYIWQSICIRELNINEPLVETTETEIGLARNKLGWKQFFIHMHCSDVFVWGESSGGRLGLPLDQYGRVESPVVVPGLRHKMINFLGKTAEVGSIAISKSGHSFYVWGSRAGTPIPVCITMDDLNCPRGDRVVHCSCGHDSGFIVVMASGDVYHCRNARKNIKKEFINLSKLLKFEEKLQPGEKPIWCLGSQCEIGGVVTNFSNVIYFQSYSLDRYILQWSYKTSPELFGDVNGDISFGKTDSQEEEFPYNVIAPMVQNSNVHLKFIKVAFGHKYFYAISDSHELYRIFLRGAMDYWEKVPNTDGLKIIDVDSGTEHHGFVTADGDAYTWGCGSMGILGHGDQDNQKHPKEVKWFCKNNMKVAAIGCGGYVSWSGGFTIYLLNDNRLFYTGCIGNQTYQLLPKQIITPALASRHILSISAGEDWAGIVVSKKTIDNENDN